MKQEEFIKEYKEWFGASPSSFEFEDEGLFAFITHLLEKREVGVSEEVNGKLLREYVKTKANQDECVGFINGMDAICNTHSPQSDAVEFAEWVIKETKYIYKHGSEWESVELEGEFKTTKELHTQYLKEK